MSTEEADSAVVEALYAMIRSQYGHRLTPQELEEVRREIEQSFEYAQALKTVPLTNADEPFSLFTPYRAHQP